MLVRNGTVVVNSKTGETVAQYLHGNWYEPVNGKAGMELEVCSPAKSTQYEAMSPTPPERQVKR